MNNNKLSVAYRAEMFRLFKSKSVWIFFIIVTVVVLSLLIVLSSVSFKTSSYNTWNVPEDVDAAIAKLDAKEAEYLALREESSQIVEIDNVLYAIRAERAVYKYFKDNGITEGKYRDFEMSQTILNAEEVYDYVSYAMLIGSSFIVFFYGAIAAGSLAGERKTGTLKISLLRPVSRKDIVFAKFLSYFTFASVTLIAEFFISTIFGLIATSGFMTPVVMVFNATSVSIINPFLALLLMLFFKLILVAVMIMGAVFISVICNGKVPAILLFLFLMCGMFSESLITLISILLLKVDLAGFIPINACDLTRCFSLTAGAGVGTVIPYIVFTVIYAVIFTVLSVVLFNRQDN